MAVARAQQAPVPSYNHGSSIIAVCSVFLSLMIIFAASRFYTKWYLNRKLKWDDLTCAIAVLTTLADFTATVLLAKKGLGTDIALDMLDDSFLKANYVAVIAVPPTLLLVKLSFYLLYLQLFHPKIYLRWSIYVGALLTTTFYFAATIAQLAIATPSRKETFVDKLTPRTLKALNNISTALGVFGVISDLYIFVLPIIGVWQLKLGARQKIGVILVFLTGSLACVSSIVGLAYRTGLSYKLQGVSSLAPVTILALVEMTVGISCASMPAFAAMLRHHLPASIKHRFSALLSRRVDSLPSFFMRRRRQPVDPHNNAPYSNLDQAQADNPKLSKSLTHSDHFELEHMHKCARGEGEGSLPLNNDKIVDDGIIRVEVNIEQNWYDRRRSSSALTTKDTLDV